MNRIIVSLAVIAASGLVFAELNTPRRIPRVQFTGKQGGIVIDRRPMKGRLVIVNAQSEVDMATIASSTDKFSRDAKIKIDCEYGKFSLHVAKRIGEATVYAISDDTLPVTMIAMEEGWGFVNVAKLRTEKLEFFKSRIHKEIVRVAGFLLGAGDSTLYPMCLTGCVRDVAYLDKNPNKQLPNDVMQRIIKAMPEMGIVPYRLVTYRMACHEGWAPAPTNDIQKAIWDKVHAVPKNPMKIEFDPKKGR